MEYGQFTRSRNGDRLWLEKTEVDEKPYLFGGRETHLKRQRETVVESSVGAEVGVPE